MHPVRTFVRPLASLVVAGAILIAAPAAAQTAGRVAPAEQAAGTSKVDAITIKQSTTAGYMKFDDIKGESNAAGHNGEIELTSYSWGSGANSSRQTRAATLPGTLTVTKRVDGSSPSLAEASRRSRRFNAVTLTLTSDGRSERVTLYDVVVTSVQRSAGGDVPTETISFNFQKIGGN